MHLVQVPALSGGINRCNLGVGFLVGWPGGELTRTTHSEKARKQGVRSGAPFAAFLQAGRSLKQLHLSSHTRNEGSNAETRIPGGAAALYQELERCNADRRLIDCEPHRHGYIVG